MELLMITILSVLNVSAFGRTSYLTNQYMDRVLHSYLPSSSIHHNVDPATIANFSVDYTVNSGSERTKVNVDYYGGKITGLLDVERAGDCSPIRRVYQNATLNCTIVFRNIRFQYMGRIKYGNLPTSKIDVQANMTHTFAYTNVTTNIRRNYPVLNTALLTRIGTITSKHMGTGIIRSKLHEINSSPFNRRLYTEFSHVFYRNFVTALGNAVSRVSVPL